jgi:hypothetical protein
MHCTVLAFECGKDSRGYYTEVNDPEIYKWIRDTAGGPPDTPSKTYFEKD